MLQFLFLTLNETKIKLPFYLLFYLITFTCTSQSIITAENQTALQLVQNVLFNSPCASLSNVSVSGGNFSSGEKSWGYFNSNSSTFPFSEGIILSTGKISNAVGPNSFISDDGGSMGWGTDPDLNQALSINNTINATVLEFDFIPFGDKISFDYIFSSEEYHDSATCNYSDGFAFLLKPVGSSTYQNLAVIPNTNIPVKVTTVHPEIPGFCQAQNEYYFESFNDVNHPTNFNGQTKVLTAKADVIPGTTYHIKLVIADEGNYRYDSAIFIKGSSFNLGVDLGIDRLFSTQNPVCPNEFITLDATSSATNYQWKFNGVPITGATNSTFTLTPPYSSIQNGIYSVEATYNLSCVITSEIELEFSPDIIVNQQIYSICDEDEDGITTTILQELIPTLFSNLPSNFTVAFFESATSTIPLSNIFQNTSPFSQIIYANFTNNSCYNPIPITLNITTFGASITDETISICDGNSIFLYADSGYQSYIWNTGDLTDSIQVSSSGIYTVTIENAINCTRIKTFNVIASEIATIESIIINGITENNSIEIIVSGNGNYLYSLDGINYQESAFFYNLNQGENTIFVYDTNLCGITSQNFIMVGIPKFFTPNEDGINDYWNIVGLKNESNSKSTIFIYNRYGKLIEQISAVGLGWNGMINGSQALSDDYWFIINLENGTTAKGHFTLKR